jgi:hypothetical protein
MRRFIIISALFGVVLSLSHIVPAAEAIVVTQLDLTGGSVDFEGRFSRKLDRLLDQSGQLTMNEYQPIGDIVPSITKGRRTFSLFTSGFSGAPAPSATIDGSSITVDLSSLFFSVSRGDHFRVWNIGGIATGIFNPDTLEFCLSWDHLVGNRSFLRPMEFTLQGRAVPAEVPLPGGIVLFVTGLLLMIAALRWWRSPGWTESVARTPVQG